MAQIKWTKNQLDAIYLEGTNIIVSAGAGSGKTAVLTERIIQKLLKGVKLDSLLVLTFTKNAAQEMRTRIKNRIKSEEKIAHLAKDVDNAFITNFDSYTLYLIKKYHYLLDVNKDVTIIDSNILNIIKKEFLDNYFEELYSKKDPKFCDFIKSYTVKDDASIKEDILSMSNALDLLIDKEKYLDSYIESYYNENNYNNIISSYYNETISPLMEELAIYVEKFIDSIDDKTLEKFEGVYDEILECDNYNSLAKVLVSFKSPSLTGKDIEDETKELKKEIGDIIKAIKELLKFENEDIIKQYIKNTKQDVEVIIDIIKKLNEHVSKYKYLHSAFEFIDLAKMILTLLKNNKDILNELKASISEILVDEYQDTSDIQEEFVKLVGNNNVYMVGDVKQSIYRFRNANPNIFIDKYLRYQNNDGGIKIDLTNNFRSRKEVVDGINNIFNPLMTLDYGGADYQKSHQMTFGNKSYLNTNQNQEIEINLYEHSKESEFSPIEFEINYIVQDIKNKIESKFLVTDKETKTLRPCTYKDFTILLSKSKYFDTFKKVLELNKIPTYVLQDDYVSKGNLIYIIKNILILLKCLYKDEINEDFKYSFTSIARSFLIKEKDANIYKCIKNKSFFNYQFIKDLKQLSKQFEYLSNKDILRKIYDIFAIYQNTLSIDDILKNNTQIQYFFKFADSLSNLNIIGISFIESLEKMINEEEDIRLTSSTNDEDKVNILTIHKSKGLEYPITYFADFSSKFNNEETKKMFIFDKKFGFITPFKDDELIHTSILKTSYNSYIKKEDISERIRLLYVAITRAKEKAIIVTPRKDKKVSLSSYSRSTHSSFQDLIYSLYSIMPHLFNTLDMSSIIVDTSYRYISSVFSKLNLKKANNNEINYVKLNIDTSIKEKIKISKDISSLISNETNNALRLGLKLHEALECLDFKNPDYSSYDSFTKRKLSSFLSSALLKDVSEANIFKEYEFLYEDNNQIYQGIIDLFLLYDDHIDIIDYKLKNVDDEHYISQLNNYKKYLSTKFDLPIHLYLYSILDEKIQCLDELIKV